MTTKITLVGRLTIRFTETGASIVGPGNGGSYLHLDDSHKDLAPPSAVLARYRMSRSVSHSMLGLPDINDHNHPDYVLAPGLGATVARWAHPGLSPETVARMAGLTSTPAIHYP